MRNGGIGGAIVVLIAFTAAGVLAAGAASAPTASATCPAGQKAATIAGKHVCLWVGRLCIARRELIYRAAGFTCRNGHLARRTTAPPVTTPAAPPPPRGSRDNPFPLGTEVTFGTTWRITVTGVTPDATAAVLAQNIFNTPPQPGYQFFMVSIRETYIGAGSANFFAVLHLRAVGASNVGYTAFNPSCGVLPGLTLTGDEPTLFTGGSVEGNECWSVLSSDAASLEMYVDTAPPTFFALR